MAHDIGYKCIRDFLLQLRRNVFGEQFVCRFNSRHDEAVHFLLRHSVFSLRNDYLSWFLFHAGITQAILSFVTIQPITGFAKKKSQPPFLTREILNTNLNFSINYQLLPQSGVF